VGRHDDNNGIEVEGSYVFCQHGKYRRIETLEKTHGKTLFPSAKRQSPRSPIPKTVFYFSFPTLRFLCSDLIKHSTGRRINPQQCPFVHWMDTFSPLFWGDSVVRLVSSGCGSKGRMRRCSIGGGEAEEGKHLPISESLYKTRFHPTLPSLNRGKGRFGRLSFEWARKGVDYGPTSRL